MKPLPFKIPSTTNASIKVEHDILTQFYPHYHTHQELQLVWIMKGEGTAFIGDKIIPFTEGEIFLLSSNLPHVFRSDPTLHKVESLSIFFPQSIFNNNQSLAEFDRIHQFITGFTQGIGFNKKESSELKALMCLIKNAIGLKRILLLIELVNLIAIQNNTNLIASSDYATPKTSDGEKISGIIEHLYSNYTSNISLNEVANIANMTPQAFCRYFKRHTKQSMVQYLNQIRIGKACKWLRDDKYTVTQSCYQAGFNNISNFNRHFKTITGYTPSGYIAKQKALTN